MAISLSGGYHHTDYLLRRSDINLPNAPLALTSEGAADLRHLVQQGGMISRSRQQPAVRYLRYGHEMAPTGFSDYYEAGLESRGAPLRALLRRLIYLFPRPTTGNQPGDRRSADQLSPFPNDPAGSGGFGDAPFRHSSPGAGLCRLPDRRKYPIRFGLRYRRSGLPFTQGSRRR